MKTNKILGIAVLVLVALSAWTYRESVTRASRFERGQKFLANLNPDEIAQIIITKGGEVAHMRRSGDKFVVVDAGNYPAKNEAVNRFIQQVLDLSLEKKVGSGESLEQELELTPDGENTVDVVFKDEAENVMVQFLVGKVFEDGGNYVRRTDQEESEIYLTSQGAYFSTESDQFLEKEIVSVQEGEIASIRGSDFTVAEIDGQLKLADVPAGKKEASTKMGQIKSALTALRFDKHFLADDPEVSSLPFQPSITVDLKDRSGYQLALAQKEDRHYIKIRGFHQVQEIAVAQDDSEEVVREKSELLARADEIADFNTFHGSWVYEVSKTIADKLRLGKNDLLEDA